MNSFLAALLSLATIKGGNFNTAVSLYENCNVLLAYGKMRKGSAEFDFCEQVGVGIRLQFVSDLELTEYEELLNKDNKSDTDYARMQEITLSGYRGWATWKQDNKELHQELIDQSIDEVK